MATPPSSRGMSPNLELSHSASHLPSRFHCTSGQLLHHYNRFQLGHQCFVAFFRGGGSFLLTLIVLIRAGGKGTPASSTPATSSPPPTLSDDFPIISLPANTVQSSPPRKVRFNLKMCPQNSEFTMGSLFVDFTYTFIKKQISSKWLFRLFLQLAELQKSLEWAIIHPQYAMFFRTAW